MRRTDAAINGAVGVSFGREVVHFVIRLKLRLIYSFLFRLAYLDAVLCDRVCCLGFIKVGQSCVSNVLSCNRVFYFIFEQKDQHKKSTAQKM